MTVTESTGTGTITVRKVPAECMDALKKMAKDNNRSMEAEVRSLLEDCTTEYLAHRITTNADLVEEMWRILDGNGLGPDEELCPPRNTYDFGPRPVDLGLDDDDDQEDEHDRP